MSPSRMAKRVPAKVTSLQPVEWRMKAAEYLDKARSTGDVALHIQFSELAARYLDMAKQLEHLEVDSQ
jgi:hypothetical protein